jgi:hypothetical protein
MCAAIYRNGFSFCFSRFQPTASRLRFNGDIGEARIQTIDG